MTQPAAVMEERRVVPGRLLRAVSDAGRSGRRADLDSEFARFLHLDVANGDASLDTVRGYRGQLAAWVAWCAEHAVHARTASTDNVKRYREDLVAQGRQPTTIAPKLNVLRRVYAAAVAAGLRADNPALGIRAPARPAGARGLRLPVRGRAGAAVPRRAARRHAQAPARSGAG